MTSVQLSVEATTRPDVLLERSSQLDALEQHLGGGAAERARTAGPAQW